MPDTPHHRTRSTAITPASAACLAAGIILAAFVIRGPLPPQPTQPAATTAPATTNTNASHDTPELDLARALSKAFNRAASTIEPSVVHITSAARVQQVRQDIFGRRYAVGEPRLQQTGLGSGVIVDARGHILTNNHVVAEADRLFVRLHDGRQTEATLVGADEATDLAVLRIEASDLHVATFGDSESLEIGEWVLAAGSPFGFEQTVTAGIVSAKGRRVTGSAGGRYEEFIQTDAAINPGNSGGPLVNLDGHVVGINTAIASRTGGSVGIGFAIPSDMARPVLQFITEHGRVERGWLGVYMQALTPEQAREHGITDGAVVVEDLIPRGPADRAGLRPGDIITAYEGRRVQDTNRLRNAIALTPPGRTATLTVKRNGEQHAIQVTPVDMFTGRALELGGQRIPALALIVADPDVDLTPSRDPAPGVRILEADPEGPAARAGLRTGDLIIGIDGRRITDAADLNAALEQADLVSGIRINLIRGNVRGFIDFRADR